MASNMYERTSNEDNIFELNNFGNSDINGVDAPPSYVDVIIPVYNAYDDLIKCLKSVFLHRAGYRVILINDKSTDPRIGVLFSTLASWKCDWLFTMENEVNLGFVKSVNKGMKFSENDVILLNSDTIVTKGWANKIRDCAYSSEKIATVTPFTNNGTICSIPKFCEANDVPEGFTVNSFAEFVEAVSFNMRPEIPTAVGFCMFIRRSVINDLGYFDEESYGKGYGEENDFCMRAIRKGYTNVLCDNTYVYHREGASFSTERNGFMDKNSKVLFEKYPEYLPAVQKFTSTNPLKAMQDNIRTRMKTWCTDPKKRILFVLHHAGGGTEKNVNDIIESLHNDYVFYIFQSIEDGIFLTEVNNGERIIYYFKLPYVINPISYTFTNFTFFDAEYANVVMHILNTFRIDLIHVQHLIGHKLDIFKIAREMGLPLILMVHDYYTICPRIHLLDENDNSCMETIDLEKCRNCLSRSMNLQEDFIYDWRQKFGEAIDSCDLIVFPTRSVLATLSKYYQLPREKTMVIEHGQNIEKVSAGAISDELKRPFHIAFIGGLSVIKGREIFYQLAGDSELRNRIKWSIIGVSDIHSTARYYPQENINITGTFDGFEELKKIYLNDRIDLAIFPSLCPETYSYTLSESWTLGVPVLVSGLGALKERVESTGGGWIADHIDHRSFKSKIVEIMSSSEDYAKKTAAVQQIKIKTIDEMGQDYKKAYDKLMDLKKPRYETRYVLSNHDLYNAIEENKQRYNPEVSRYEKLNLLDRFILCIRQNGYRYTAVRFMIFVTNVLRKKA